MKKDLDSLIEQALDNIKNDRQLTETLLMELQEYMGVPGNQDRYSDSGPVAAKYVETLQRSNEQLVKLATIQKKGEKENMNLSNEDREEIFSQLNEVVNGD